MPAKRGPADDLNVCLRNSTQSVPLCLYASGLTLFRDKIKNYKTLWTWKIFYPDHA